MTERRGVLVRFPPEVLADLDAEAKRTGKSRNDIIVARCQPPQAPIPAEVISPKPGAPTFSHGRGKTVVAPAKRQRADALTVGPSLHYGPAETRPGTRLKKR